MRSSGNYEGGTATALQPDDDQERRALVRRLIASRHFAKAQQLQKILLYLLDRSLHDPAAIIHEQEIACTVLGRKADFNSHEDNIVRVQMSHLRRRLDEYFAAEGSGEPVLVSVPRGSYALRFEPRAPVPELVYLEPVLAPAVAPGEALSSARKRFSPWLLGAAAILILAAAILTLWPRPVPGALPRTAKSQAIQTSDDLLWSRIFSPPETNIVVADTCLVMLQDMLNTDIQLSDYLDGKYPGSLLDKADPILRRNLLPIATRQYTSLADLNSARRLSELSHGFAATPPAIRYSRHLNVRDFKSGNFILLGSRRGIPWVRLFESQLNFSLEEDPANRTFYFSNKRRLAGEPEAWRPTANRVSATDTYADIALLPNLGNNGQVLILAGIDMAASEAAAEFVAGPGLSEALAAILPKTAGHPQLRYFELVLRTHVVAGAARSSQVVSSRLIDTLPTGPGSVSR